MSRRSFVGSVVAMPRSAHLHRLRSLPRSAALALVGSVLLVGLAPPSAEAATTIDAVTVVNGDLVTDKPAVVAIAGMVEPKPQSGPRLALHVNDPSLPCAPTTALNAERKLSEVRDVGEVDLESGSFEVRVSFVPRRPGPVLLCTYVIDVWGSWPAPTLTQAQTATSVRDPRTALSMQMPAGRFTAGITTTISVTSEAEVERELRITTNPVGVPCAASFEANLGSPEQGLPILGGPISSARAYLVPAVEGHYRLCGYVHRGYDDPTPNLVVAGPTFWSGPATCRIGPAPRQRSGSVHVSCGNTEGQIEIDVRRGRSKVRLSRSLDDAGRARLKVRDLRLSTRKASRLTIRQDGVTIASRMVRARR